MTLRSLRCSLLPALALALAAVPASAQDASTQLAQLIRTSAASSNPVLDFVAGFQAMPNFDMDQAQIRAALAQADVDTAGVLNQLLSGTRSIAKSGDRVSMRRSGTYSENMGSGGIKFDRSTAFDLRTGSVAARSGDAAARLANAEGTYVHLTDIDGIEVRKDGGNFYNLYELYFVTEGGKPVVHLKAGVFFHKEWHRIELPSPAPAAPEVVASAEVPAPADQVSSEEPVADAPAPEALPLPESRVSSLADQPSAGDLDDGSLPVLSLAPAEEATITDAPADKLAPAEPRDAQGLLTALEDVTAQQQAPSVDDGAHASIDRAQTAQAEAPALDRPVEAAEELSSLPENTIVDPSDPTSTPISLPEPEEKERIDAEADQAGEELDSMGTKLDELIALIHQDRAEAEARIEARIEALEAQNRRMEQQLAAIQETLANQANRSLPGDDYRARRPLDPRADRLPRDPRYDRRPMDVRTRDGYDPRTRTTYDPRTGVTYDEYGRPVDPRYTDRTRAPIMNPDGTYGRQPSKWERFFQKIVQGIQRGLQQRYARQAAANMANRTALMAAGNPNNQPYADYRMRSTIANSNLGRTLGFNNPSNVPSTLIPAANTRIVNLGGAQPTYGTPTYVTPTYGTPTYGTPTYGTPTPVTGPTIYAPVGGQPANLPLGFDARR
jgi:hypothetical protein